jgi:hypothetical protein
MQGLQNQLGGGTHYHGYHRPKPLALRPDDPLDYPLGSHPGTIVIGPPPPVPPPSNPSGDSAMVPLPSGTPVVQSISPTSGPEAGETQIDLYGSGLSGVTGVSFGSAGAGLISNRISDNHIQVLNPGVSGPLTVPVTVTAGSGPSAPSGSYYSFTYT